MREALNNLKAKLKDKENLKSLDKNSVKEIILTIADILASVAEGIPNILVKEMVIGLVAVLRFSADHIG